MSKKTKKSSREQNFKRDNAKKQQRNYTGKYNRVPQGRGTDEDYEKSPGKYASCHTGDENDPSWYNKLATLIRDVARIPFSYQIGRPMYFDSFDMPDLNVPGILALDYICLPGIAKSATDGVNIAATALYQTIRKNLSTVAGYASADVMMYVLAVDSMIQLYNYIVRAFGTLNLYSSVNYNYGNALLEAQGFSPSSLNFLRSNTSDYMSQFNQLVYKVSEIYLPTQFSIIDRHAWLFSNVFTDGESAKSQIYVHRPYSFYILDETSSEEGTMLKVVERPSTMIAAIRLFDQMIDTFRNSDSMNKIAADMQRAIIGSTWKFAYIGPEYTIAPVISKEVLSQIENTTILNIPTKYDITQSVDKNIILCNPEFLAESSDYSDMDNDPSTDYPVPNDLWNRPCVINMHWENPSADDIAVATRNMNMLVMDETDPSIMRLSSCGSDICVNADMYSWNCDLNQTEVKTFGRFMTVLAADPDSWYSLLTPDLAKWMAFDWSPQLLLCGELNGWLTGPAVLTEYSNFTQIDRELLDRIHNNIITSMWSLPQLGTFNPNA